MSNPLIVNARLVNEDREFDGDLRISRGRIAEIGSGLVADGREQVVDAAGRREGTTFHARIASTWVNGQRAWDGEHLVGAPQGQRLAFAR